MVFSSMAQGASENRSAKSATTIEQRKKAPCGARTVLKVCVPDDSISCVDSWPAHVAAAFYARGSVP